MSHSRAHRGQLQLQNAAPTGQKAKAAFLLPFCAEAEIHPDRLNASKKWEKAGGI